jgi:hypothetical protein
MSINAGVFKKTKQINGLFFVFHKLASNKLRGPRVLDLFEFAEKTLFSYLIYKVTKQ